MAKNEFVDMFVKAIGEVTNGLGIKARELAEKLGISKGTLSNYMKDSTFKGRNWSCLLYTSSKGKTRNICRVQQCQLI